MSITIKKNDLQSDKYNYIWNKDFEDSEYTGIKDQNKVDKNEGYEVLYFIQALMNKHELKYISDIQKIEDMLHSPELAGEVMRDKLIQKLEKKLKL